MKKIRVGIVNYLNTKPLLYGIVRSALMDDIELKGDHPSSIARMLLEDEIDIGLVPVAILPRMKEYYMYTNYCIACNGPVASVALFSEEPIDRVQSILLDYQSRTSVALLRLLLKEYWRLSPQLIDAEPDYLEQIKGSRAGLVIGDRALQQRSVVPYIYDLGEAWKAFTGLPFVFAAWISNKPLPDDFISAFDEANGLGLSHIDQVVAENPYPYFNLHDYYTKHIDYRMDAEKRLGLERFMGYLLR